MHSINSSYCWVVTGQEKTEKHKSLPSAISYTHPFCFPMVLGLLNKTGKPGPAKIIPFRKTLGESYLLYQEYTLGSASSGPAPGWRPGFSFHPRYLQCKLWMIRKGTQPMPRNLRKELTLGLHTAMHTILEWEWNLLSKCFVGVRERVKGSFLQWGGHTEAKDRSPNSHCSLFCLAEKRPKF